jgi:hypothetical protein
MTSSKIPLNAYAEFHYVFYAECHNEVHYAECHNAECRHTECHYSECRGDI